MMSKKHGFHAKVVTEAAELKEDNQSTASLNEKLDNIIKQNKIIAEGMIAVHDTVKGLTKTQSTGTKPGKCIKSRNQRK